MGDKTHPSSTQIYAMVEEIEARLREYGHQPSTASMLFDVLSYHSERLAIAAYALIASAPGVAIRINKNLRVHGRDIIMRDRTGFYHGECSCGQFSAKYSVACVVTLAPVCRFLFNSFIRSR
jgi:hypothetical protein